MTDKCRHDLIPGWCADCLGRKPGKDYSTSAATKATAPRRDPLAPREDLAQKYDGSPLTGNELPHGITRDEVKRWQALARDGVIELVCDVCLKTFVAKRRDAVACSAKCRKALSRAKQATETMASQPDASFTAIVQTEEFRLWQVSTRPKAAPGSNDWDHFLPLDEKRLERVTHSRIDEGG
jgi:hypothetical protein